MIKGIHHISMKCSSEELYQKVLEFYGQALQLPVLRTWKTGIMFQAGNEIIEIFTDGVEELPQGVIRHFAFATDDVDKCVKAVRDTGYEILIEPKDIVIDSEPAFPARIAFCQGPLGEEIEFFQEKKDNGN